MTSLDLTRSVQCVMCQRMRSSRAYNMTGLVVVHLMKHDCSPRDHALLGLFE